MYMKFHIYIRIYIVLWKYAKVVTSTQIYFKDLHIKVVINFTIQLE